MTLITKNVGYKIKSKLNIYNFALISGWYDYRWYYFNCFSVFSNMFTNKYILLQYLEISYLKIDLSKNH